MITASPSPERAADVRVNRWKHKTGGSLTMFESFYHAFHGIWVGLKKERNIRIHAAAAATVISLGVWLKVDAASWVALILAIGIVIATEFFNTSLEHLVDISSNSQYHKSARYAKDTAAAAVLCTSIMALAVGCWVFVPKLAHIFHLI
jgi:diacylglycerol kinase